MKDYYRILDVEQGAGLEEIRKAYRRLALRHHPDRNPDDRRAADRFREIAEAYGVLSDQEKRQQYDRLSRQGGPRPGQQQEFQFSQEEILKDLFSNPRFRKTLEGLLKEFARQGFRADHRFVQRTFLGGRGIFFSGVFLWGVFGPGGLKLPGLGKGGLGRLAGPGLAAAAGRLLGNLFKGELPQSQRREAATTAADLHYRLPLAPEMAARGGEVRMKIEYDGSWQTFKVRVPPGIKDGAKLRLRSRGREEDGRRGDLYVEVCLT